MIKRSKRYKEAVKLIDKAKAYPLAEAVALAKKTANTKFEGSLEVHIKLGIDPKKAEQLVRGTINLPHGTGKSKKVVVFATGPAADAAQKVGATSIAPPSVVVVYYDGKQITRDPTSSDGTIEAQLTSKSVISAVMKTNSSIAPAVQLNDGSIFVGKPFHLSANDKTMGGIETPSLEQMLQSSEQYCDHLTIVMQKAYGPNAKVSAKR